MTTQILMFDLDDPEDRQSAKMYNDAPALFSAAWEFQNRLRNWKKHECDNEEEAEILEEVWDVFWDEFNGLLED